MDAQIVVASRTFGSKFQGLVYAQLRKLLPPGYRIVEALMPESEPSPESQHAQLMKLIEVPSRPVALVALCLVPPHYTVAAYAEVGVPVIMVDNEVPGASTITSDNARGGALAAQHLLERGRRRVGVIYGGPRARKDYNAEQRLRGFEKRLLEAGVALAPEGIVDAPDYSRKDGMDAFSRLIGLGSTLDGLFCAAGDACAMGFLAEARNHGLKIPEQLAVVGYDDSPLAGIAEPPLTTLRQPMDIIAQHAVRLATAEREAILRVPARLLVEPVLVVRAST
jgi:LacI family transcriptional regulator